MTQHPPLLVFGKTGQVAQELAKRAPNAVFAGRDLADLSDPAACAALIRDMAPTQVINAAAYTAVDKAEDEDVLAMIVNGEAPTAMAEAAREVGAAFVHISTDYVFDGSGELPWEEDAVTGPLGAYGRSKLAGEQGVQRAGGVYAILRTAWVFSAHGNNFVKTMLRLGAERDRLTIVGDQFGGPTPAGSIAATCLNLAEELRQNSDASGVYHYCGAPDVSWADFARAIFADADLNPEVVDIPTSAYPTPAARPANSRLSCQKIDTVMGIKRPDWRAELSHVLDELEGSV
ncbi:MAG: dTDP-4-dehydrorhamnose reductase [Aliishimia sp.]